MTTLFPQIKRVDEDETSKIIKDVLFSNQDDTKLDKILEEFMHLTEELRCSDVEDEDDGDGDEDDDDIDEDDDDEDEDSEDDDSSESQESTPPREPTSWNLDQFIPAKQKQQPPPPQQSQTTPIRAPPEKKQQQEQKPRLQDLQQPTRATQEKKQQQEQKPRLQDLQQPTRSTPEKKQQQEQKPQLQDLQQPTRVPLEKKQQQEQRPQLQDLQQPVRVPSEKKQQQEQKPQLQDLQQPTRVPLEKKQQQEQETLLQDLQQPQQQQQRENEKQPSDKKSCMVQIDLSKLKRIPQTKVPTPNVTGSSSMTTAKALKHEADAEKDKTKQAIKYLESCMYFVLHGQEMEAANNDTQYYSSVNPLFRHVVKMTSPINIENLDNMTNLKIHALALKCLSLLQMKMYKARERELPGLIKTTSTSSSPIQQADEVLIAIKPLVLSAYKRQVAIYSCLKAAHDYWHSVEQLCDQHPALRIFFSTIESNCGPLTMVSPFPKLMDHVQCGLKLLRTS